jgi:hypothetical protein
MAPLSTIKHLLQRYAWIALFQWLMYVNCASAQVHSLPNGGLKPDPCWCTNGHADIIVAEFSPGPPSDDPEDDFRIGRKRQLLVCLSGEALFLDHSGESPRACQGQLPDSVVSLLRMNIHSLIKRNPWPVPEGPDGVADWFPGRRLVFTSNDTTTASYRSIGDTDAEHIVDRLFSFAQGLQESSVILIRFRQITFGRQPPLQLHTKPPSSMEELGIYQEYGECVVCPAVKEELLTWLDGQKEIFFLGTDNNYHQVWIMEFK